MPGINQDLTILLLEKALDACTLRHRIIANNIANVDTPGFKGSRVIFEEELKKVLSGNNSLSDLKNIKPMVVKEENSSFREDLNNVDIEKEMVKLSENTLRYNLYIQSLITKLRTIRSAIEGK